MSKLKRGQIEGEQEKIRSLISDISHQTKTPIANVLLYAQLLCEQVLPEDAKPLAAQVSAGAEKLNFLIQALVKASRLESGIIKITPQKNNIIELIVPVIGECVSKAREKNISIFADNLPETVYALFNAKWCGEALYNIVDNAIKYTDAGGSVEISAKSYEMFARIDVADTGLGIHEKDLPLVFGRFWRADPNTEGVGIGLYLAREIIGACGGYIKVNSVVGEGSTFSVFLPVAQGSVL